MNAAVNALSWLGTTGFSLFAAVGIVAWAFEPQITRRARGTGRHRARHRAVKASTR